MSKKNKLLIIIFAIMVIILITVLVVISISKKQKEENKITVNTDVNQRVLINDFLQNNPYISSMNDFEEGFISDTDIVKSAIYSNDVELEYIVTEEIVENEILSTFEGNKKSIENIRQYSKEVFGRENLALNFVETYFNDSGFLIINEEYVFFSKQEQPEKVYMAVSQTKQNDLLELEIYEYTVNQNKEKLDEMIQTGVIDENIPTSNKFVIKIKIENEKISVISKHK